MCKENNFKYVFRSVFISVHVHKYVNAYMEINAWKVFYFKSWKYRQVWEIGCFFNKYVWRFVCVLRAAAFISLGGLSILSLKITDTQWPALDKTRKIMIVMEHWAWWIYCLSDHRKQLGLSAVFLIAESHDNNDSIDNTAVLSLMNTM